MRAALSASWKNVVGTGCPCGLRESKHSFVINLSPSTTPLCDSWSTRPWIYTVWLAHRQYITSCSYIATGLWQLSCWSMTLLECCWDVIFKLKKTICRLNPFIASMLTFCSCLYVFRDLSVQCCLCYRFSHQFFFMVALYRLYLLSLHTHCRPVCCKWKSSSQEFSPTTTSAALMSGLVRA